MPQKIIKISHSKALNCKIHPVLYKVYLRLHDTLGAEIVHRRKRTSNMCIEIVFRCGFLEEFIGSTINTLREAETSGFRVICRRQTKPEHAVYKGLTVYQLFLSPVHPKKRREMQTTVTPLSSLSSPAASAAYAAV